jgi:hypothetical protein
MDHFPYPTYLPTYRERWRLTQPELGALLGHTSGDAVFKYENLTRTPSVAALIGCAFIFGEPARELFPALYATVESAVTLRAVDLAEKIGESTDKKSLAKRALLESIARRAAGDTTSV